MDYENFEARVLDPIRKQLGLEKLNFQILRRTFASLAVGTKKGTLKDVQKQLRHSRPDTTLENYVKEIPGAVYVMADAMWDGMFPQEISQKTGELQTTAHILHTGRKRNFQLVDKFPENNEIWCARRDSNSRPTAPEAAALSS
jgi:hypothetical protein